MVRPRRGPLDAGLSRFSDVPEGPCFPAFGHGEGAPCRNATVPLDSSTVALMRGTFTRCTQAGRRPLTHLGDPKRTGHLQACYRLLRAKWLKVGVGQPITYATVSASRHYSRKAWREISRARVIIAATLFTVSSSRPASHSSVRRSAAVSSTPSSASSISARCRCSLCWNRLAMLALLGRLRLPHQPPAARPTTSGLPDHSRIPCPARGRR
jgi:hypothetical protein